MFIELSSLKKTQAQKHEENCTKIKLLNTGDEKKNLLHTETKYYQPRILYSVKSIFKKWKLNNVFSAILKLKEFISIKP